MIVDQERESVDGGGLVCSSIVQEGNLAKCA